MKFSHWLPLGQENGIVVDEEGMRILLWFDEKCTWYGHQLNTNELINYASIPASNLNVDVQIRGLTDDLLEYIQRPYSLAVTAKKHETLQLEYEKIGDKILESVIRRVNRLISYARSYKGQYWLKEFSIDSNLLRFGFIHFKARGQVDEGSHFSFHPFHEYLLVGNDDQSRYITELEWAQFKSFVSGSSKPNLVGELLAGAEYLLNIDHYRSAITEAVTALEVAVSSFAKNCNTEKTFAPDLAQRLSLNNLKSQIKHLGFSATVNYLLPIILSEELLPTSVLTGCQSALNLRQNIVHNGQRNIQEKDACAAIFNIKKCCEVLEKLTC